MSVYTSVRSVYRWLDRAVFKHLPVRWDARARSLMLPLARRLFPGRIQARSVCEFAGAASIGAATPGRLPAWAEAEVAELAKLEPALAPLVGEGASVQPYVIPWDLTYVGDRYARARHQLADTYACFVLAAGGNGLDAAGLRALPQPRLLIDVDADPQLARLAQATDSAYLALPAEHLDANDHCAVLARLVLQLAPAQVHVGPQPLLQQCIQRHGLALASVSELIAWSDSPIVAG